MNPGATLAKMEQHNFYRILRDKRRLPRRRHTETNIGIIQDDIQETFNTWPTPERVWLAMKHRDLTRKTRDFLWKSVQGAYKIGPYWSHIAGYEDRVVCPNCDEMEDLDHILLWCRARVCKQAWNLADRVWAKRTTTAIPKTMGTILGCTLATFNTNGKKDKGKGRLFQILISETAYLIWRLQNERRIQQGDRPLNYPLSKATWSEDRMGVVGVLGELVVR